MSNTGNLPAIKKMAENEALKGKLANLVENSTSYIQSVIATCGQSKQLIECSAKSVWAVAVKAATLKLPVDPELGQAYIVPYRGVATFQLGAKGLIQLAIRSAMYKTINVTCIYNDEIKSYNPITEEMEFKDGYNPNSMRFKAGSTPVGYYARFELKNGFVAGKFMTREQVDAHGKEYSQAYKYDINKGRKSSPWSTNFDAMGKKTVLKALLNHFGYLSVDIQTAWSSEEEAPVVHADIETVNTQQQNNNVTQYAMVEHPHGNQQPQQQQQQNDQQQQFPPSEDCPFE